MTAAGLTDIHCHGAMGENFGESAAGSRAAATYFDAYGIRVVASLVSAPAAVLTAAVATLAPLVRDGTLAGIHIEGPFLAPTMRGAHDPDYLSPPDPQLVEDVVAVCVAAGVPDAVRHWTFAPELPGAEQLIDQLARFGIRPALGHTAADAGLVRRALDHALNAAQAPPLVTHLFNGMTPFHHRAGGPATAALAAASRGEAIVELIADGVHVAPDVVRLVFDVVGADYIALISDAMAATGLGDGQYALGGMPVAVQGGTARVADGSIAGSTRSLRDCANWAVQVAGVDPHDVLCAASRTPSALARGASPEGPAHW